MLRIPLRGGDEYDALTRGGKRVNIFKAGDRVAAKRRYRKRLRRALRAADAHAKILEGIQ